jgi:hypothetical protein
MMQRDLALVGVACMLSACFKVTPTRETNFETSVPQMNCQQLKRELTYQQQILEGLQTNQKHESDAGRIAATAFSLGYNLANNAVEDNDRAQRVHAIEENIDLIESTQKKRKCT